MSKIPNADLYANEVVKTDMVSMNVRVPAELRDAFQKLCASRGTEVSKVIRNFVQRELESAK